MYGLPDTVKTLSAAEEQVMLAVWGAKPPLTRWAVAQALPGTRWADTTLLSFLSRLEEKGWVQASKQGNKNVYQPRVTKRAYGVYVMRERLQTVFGGDYFTMQAALLSEFNPPQGEAEAVQKLLQEKIDATEDYDLYDPY